ncbi:MAG: hypothetical protein ACXAEN_20945 [Candidatus Thorarchaeota archaeon]|jgi:hypothetical protein
MAKAEDVICIATHAHCNVDFDAHFNHCHAVQLWSHKYHLVLIGYKGLLAADARERICDQAIDEKCSHIFILDADHIIDPSILDYLMESKDEAIVSGLICRRFHPFGQVAWGKDDKSGAYIPIHLPLDGKTYEVGVCAFGCTLINLKKLQELEKPWFRDTCDKKFDGKCRNTRSDVVLCDMFRANGEKVWIDTRALVGHMGTNILVYPQNAEDMEQFRYQYSKSFELKQKETGKYALVPKLL